MLQPRSKVYRPTDHRVVHAIIAAKIAYRTIAGMNADPAAQRGGNTALGPFMRQFSGTLLHGDRHFNASERILFHTKRCWIAEETLQWRRQHICRSLRRIAARFSTFR